MKTPSKEDHLKNKGPNRISGERIFPVVKAGKEHQKTESEGEYSSIST